MWDMRVPPPFWLPGRTGRRRYVGLGDAASLQPGLSFLRGWGGRAERIAVMVGALLPRIPVRDERVLAAWADVHGVLPGIGSALLLWTDPRKPTVFVGPVSRPRAGIAFVKSYRAPEAAAVELAGARHAVDLYGPHFRTAEVSALTDRIVAYAYLDPAAHQPPAARMEKALVERAIQAGRAALAAAAEARPLHLHADLPAVAALAPGRLSGLHALAGDEVPVVPAHGDYTPWNAFVDSGGRLCLVDYERSGPATPFADIFHLLVQPALLAGRVSGGPDLIGDLSALRSRVRLIGAGLGMSPGDWHLWFVAYLCRAIVRDGHDLAVSLRPDPRLARMIARKVRLLCDVLEEGPPSPR